MQLLITALLLFSIPSFAQTPDGLPMPQPPVPIGPWATVPGRVKEILKSPRLDYLQPDPADSSKAVEGFTAKLNLRTKIKECCGYPLGESGTFKLTFYWLAWESEYANEPYDVDIYTRHGFLIGRFPRTFVFELKLEGSGMLRDGRILNYDGRCRYGIGICFQTLEVDEHPLGKGGQGRPLEPFRSVAVDPRFVPLGTPLYLPELAGLRLPDGSFHDGCVRADDTGGGIRRRELDFFVESYANYKFLDDQFWQSNRVTPYVEEPRCHYLRRYDPGIDRRSEASDWARLEAARPKLPVGKPGRPSRSGKGGPGGQDAPGAKKGKRPAATTKKPDKRRGAAHSSKKASLTPRHGRHG